MNVAMYLAFSFNEYLLDFDILTSLTSFNDVEIAMSEVFYLLIVLLFSAQQKVRKLTKCELIEYPEDCQTGISSHDFMT